MKAQLLLVSFLLLWTGTLSIAETIAPDAPQDEMLPSSWFLDLEIAVSYDDNVFQVRSQKESDLFQTGIISLFYQTEAITGYGLAVIDRYDKNPFLDTEYYEVGIESTLGEKTFAQLYLHNAPSALLDKAEKTRVPFELATQGIGFSVEREFSNKRTLALGFAYTLLDYSEDRKDSEIRGISTTFSQPFNERLDFSLAVRFEESLAQGGSIRIFRTRVRPRGVLIYDDISYRSAEGSIQSRYHFSEIVFVQLDYSYHVKKFTTALPIRLEPLHAGREDRTQTAHVGFRLDLDETLQIKTGIRRDWLSSTDTELDFEGLRYELSIRFMW